MKKNLICSIAFIFVILVFFAGYFFIPHKMDNLPKFSYKGLNEQQITNKDLPKDKYTVIIYFSAFCDNCAIAIKKIEQDKQYDEYNKIYISSDSSKDIKIFLKRNNLNMYNHNILVDSNKSFQFDFTLGIYISYPTILVFDKDGNFVKKLNEF